MWGVIVAAVLILAIVGALLYFFVFKKKGGGGGDAKPFVLDYSNIGAPQVAIVDGHPVKPEINPANVLFFHNNIIFPLNGDVLRLRETADASMVIYQKTLRLDRTYGTGDWSLLENLETQLRREGYFTSKYTLELLRRDEVVMSHALDATYAYIEWFGADFRFNGSYSDRNPPFVVGDIVLVASADEDQLLQYLYYCVDDRSGLFQMHPLSPKKDAPATLTFDALRTRFAALFVGYVDSEFREIQDYPPAGPPPPPPTPVVVDTSAKYAAIYLKDPITNDPKAVNLVAAKVATGDTVNISDSKGDVYYQVKDLKLDSDTTKNELSNDMKYLLSGVIELIRSKNLYGLNLSVERAGATVLSKPIPADCQGVLFFDNDPRSTQVAMADSAVISDIGKARPRPASGDYDPKPANMTIWCTDPVARTYTNGADFTGTLDKLPAFYKPRYSDIANVFVSLNDQSNPAVFQGKSIPYVAPTDAGSGGGDAGSGGGDAGSGGGDAGSGGGGAA